MLISPDPIPLHRERVLPDQPTMATWFLRNHGRGCRYLCPVPNLRRPVSVRDCVKYEICMDFLVTKGWPCKSTFCSDTRDAYTNFCLQCFIQLADCSESCWSSCSIPNLSITSFACLRNGIIGLQACEILSSVHRFVITLPISCLCLAAYKIPSFPVSFTFPFHPK